MVTAVALPAIVIDLADWTELRTASWIINGYLLVSILVMPLAGQLAFAQVNLSKELKRLFRELKWRSGSEFYNFESRPLWILQQVR